MDQELFNPQSSSVISSRILYTPSAFARTSLLHLQEVGSLQAITSIHRPEQTCPHFFALLFCQAPEALPMRDRLISWARETVCSLTAERPTAIPPRMTFGRSSGVTSMRHLFQPYMKSIKSVVAVLYSTRRI